MDKAGTIGSQSIRFFCGPVKVWPSDLEAQRIKTCYVLLFAFFHFFQHVCCACFYCDYYRKHTRQKHYSKLSLMSGWGLKFYFKLIPGNPQTLVPSMSSKVHFEVMFISVFNKKGLIKTPLLITSTNLHDEFFRQYGDTVHFPLHSVFQDGFPPHIHTTSIRLIQSHFQTLNVFSYW